jgi:hypothetical protein
MEKVIKLILGGTRARRSPATEGDGSEATVTRKAVCRGAQQRRNPPAGGPRGQRTELLRMVATLVISETIAGPRVRQIVRCATKAR